MYRRRGRSDQRCNSVIILPDLVWVGRTRVFEIDSENRLNKLVGMLSGTYVDTYRGEVLNSGLSSEVGWGEFICIICLRKYDLFGDAGDIQIDLING